MSKKATWISAEAASELIGLEASTFIRYVREKKLDIRSAKATRKAKPRFVKEDVETVLNQKAT